MPSTPRCAHIYQCFVVLVTGDFLFLSTSPLREATGCSMDGRRRCRIGSMVVVFGKYTSFAQLALRTLSLPKTYFLALHPQQRRLTLPDCPAFLPGHWPARPRQPGCREAARPPVRQHPPASSPRFLGAAVCHDELGGPWGSGALPPQPFLSPSGSCRHVRYPDRRPVTSRRCS